MYYTYDTSNNFIIRFFSLFFLLREEYKERVLGSLWSRGSIRSISFKFLADLFNTNNLGSAYDSSGYQLLTKKVEKKVIEWVKQRVGAHESVIGYITSGGTEANIFLLWQAREFFSSRSLQEPIVLHTGFTHYSITKAARLVNLKSKNVFDRHESMLVMDHLYLESYLINQVKIGQYSFIIPVTLGYSSTGLSDPLDDILLMIQKLKTKFQQLNFFIWVDAAAQGLPHSFLCNKYSPMRNQLVQGYVLDFHKFGSVSLPAGVVLFKKEIGELIQSPISYLDDNDVTLLGSRPGSSAVAIWEQIIAQSDKQWKKKYLLLRRKKDYIISLIHSRFPNAEIISDPNSLTFAVIQNEYFPIIEKQSREKYGLVLCKINGLKHYKFHINP